MITLNFLFSAIIASVIFFLCHGDMSGIKVLLSLTVVTALLMTLTSTHLESLKSSNLC